MNEIKRDAQQPEVKKEEHFLFEVLRVFVIALVIVAPIRLFVAQPFVVSGASMEPTFSDSEYLIVDKLSYSFEEPQRGDVVIFRFPLEPSKFFIKRVIGLPEESLEIRDANVIITNAEHPEGFLLDESYLARGNRADGFLTITLKEGEYFVMGDNRKDSSDSRTWGTLPRGNIVGRTILRLAPLSRVSLFPGQ